MTGPELIQLIVTFFTNQNLIAKVILIILLVMYLFFSLILSRQIFLLNNTVNQITFSPIFKLLGLIHLLLVIGLLFFTITAI